MTRTTPELAPPFQASTPHQREDVLDTTYDLACSRPHTRRIFSGIGFRTWNPPAPKPRPYLYATAATFHQGFCFLYAILTYILVKIACSFGKI
ncbi:hypothetical protein AVEN_41851-1 [Araneus ventricosus]|uniref:Uncharacterized protein n=1 Tax=Araneus ventricosus TaxID=182803 RepID=A0A4Y2AC78_ARAVE|nr:hypothetical protein AVEN_41851-1 [Araneus ventricosus]